jgi:hypothetical protein
LKRLLNLFKTFFIFVCFTNLYAILSQKK